MPGIFRFGVLPMIRQNFLLDNQFSTYQRCNLTICAIAVKRNLSSFRVEEVPEPSEKHDCVPSDKVLLFPTRPSKPPDFTERKRFYNKAGIEEAEGGYQITVDNKKVKTPAGNLLVVPSKPLAMAVSVEWNSQVDTIKPANMHLTSLSNTVIDNPRTRNHDQQISHILEFLSSDSICFFADEPEELLDLQRKEWIPIMEWFNNKMSSAQVVQESLLLNDNRGFQDYTYSDAHTTWYSVPVEPSHGLLAATMPDDAEERLKAHLTPLDSWSLTGLEFAVETLKSFILTMALVENHLTVEKAVHLSRLELEFQISRWGSVEWAHDLELMETRSRVAAAVLFYSLNNRRRTLPSSS